MKTIKLTGNLFGMVLYAVINEFILSSDGLLSRIK
jgi:hypothetical protein